MRDAGRDDAAVMAGMDMAGIDNAGMNMTPTQPQPGEDTRPGSESPCSFPWSPPGDCHDMQACVPMAIAAPAVTVTMATPLISAVEPRPVPGPRSRVLTPDPPPPRA